MRPWVCSPPTITGESGNDSAWRGDGRHTLVGARLQQSQASPRTAPHGVAAIGRRLPVHASYHRGGVQEWLRTMWWRPRNPLLPGVIACRCAPPTVVGESGNGSVRCGGGRQPSTPTPLRPGEDEVSVRLPLSQASPKIAPCSVAAASNPPPLPIFPSIYACQCAFLRFRWVNRCRCAFLRLRWINRFSGKGSGRKLSSIILGH